MPKTKPKHRRDLRKRVETLIEDGQKFLRIKEYDNAIKIFRKITQINQTNCNAWDFLGYAQSKAKKYRDAEKSLIRCTKLAPNNIRYWKNLSRIREFQMDHSGAIDAIQISIKLEPNNAENWMLLGGILGTQGKSKECEEASRKAIELDPNDINALNNLANALKSQGKIDESITTYSQALNINARDQFLWCNYANALNDAKRYSDAINAIQEALKLDSRLIEAWNILGIIQKNQKNLKLSIEAFLNGLKIDAKSHRLWTNLGGCFLDKKDYEKAICAQLQSLKYAPDFALAWDNLGVTYREWDKLRESELAHKKALKFEPTNATFWNHLGITLSEMNEFNAAKIAYNKASDLAPPFIGDIWLNLSILQRIEGNLEESRSSCLKALEFDEFNPYYWNELGVVLDKQNKLPEAKQALEKAIGIDENYGSAWTNYSIVLIKNKDFDGALKACERALEINPNHATAYLHLGTLYREQGNLEKAILNYQKAIAIKPNDGKLILSLAIALLRQKKFNEAEQTFISGLDLVWTNPFIGPEDISGTYGLFQELCGQIAPEKFEKYFTSSLSKSIYFLESSHTESKALIPSPFDIVVIWYGWQIAALARSAMTLKIREFPTGQFKSIFSQFQSQMREYSKTAPEKASKCIVFWDLIQYIIDLFEKNLNVKWDEFPVALQQFEIQLESAPLKKEIKEIFSELKTHLNSLNFKLKESQSLANQSLLFPFFQEIENIIKKYLDVEFPHHLFAFIILPQLELEKKLLKGQTARIEFHEAWKISEVTDEQSEKAVSINDIDEVFEQFWGKIDCTLPIRQKDLEIIRALDDPGIKQHLYNYFLIHKLITKNCKSVLHNELEKGHGPGEISDFNLEMNVNSETIWVAIPIKSGREIGTLKVNLEKYFYQFMRPLLHFKKGKTFVFPIICASPTLDSTEVLNDYRANFNFPIKILDLEIFTRFLKQNNFLSKSPN